MATATEEPTTEPTDAEAEATRRAEEAQQRAAAEAENHAALERAVADLPEVPGRDEFLTLCQMARVMAGSGVVPKALRDKPADVLVVLMTGRDLGIPITAALRKVYVIDGQPSIAPQLKLSLIRKKGLGRVVPHPHNDRLTDRQGAIPLGPGGRVDYDPVTDAVTVIGALGETYWYTWDDAIRAGLVRKGCTPDAHTAECDASKRNRNVYQTNDVGLANFCKDNWRKNPRRLLWQRACLPERAEALTPIGWVTHDKLSVGDPILAFNAATGMTEWASVTAVNTFEARETFEIEHRSFRAVATANHEWVCDLWTRQGQWEKRRTDQFDGHPYRRLLVSAPMVDMPSKISPDDAARLGWVLTDGTIHWSGNSPSITISQSKHVAEVRRLFGSITVESAEQMVRCPNCEHEFTPRQHVIDQDHVVISRLPEHRFRLNADASRRLLALAGIRTKDDAARVPALLNQAGRSAMFRAMNLANGEQFCTGHKAVMDCWQALAAMLGKRTGRPRFNTGSWRTRCNESSVVSIKRLSVTPATVEPVWCPTTTLGTWVARIDGQVTITGNSGFCADDYFSEATLGLYDPDELGAILDDDGQLIDANHVEMPAGFGTAGGGQQGGGTEADALVDLADAWELQVRVFALPEDAQAEFRQRWVQGRVAGSLADDPTHEPPRRRFAAAKLNLVRSMLRGVEQQWKAQGRYDPETGPAALVKNVVAPAVLRLLPLPFDWTATAPPSDPTPDVPQEAVGASGMADAADTATERQGAADGDTAGSGGEPAGVLPLDVAADEAAGLLSVPDAVRSASDDDKAEWAVAYVKAMSLTDVDALLRHYQVGTKGAPNDRRGRLVFQVLEHELGIEGAVEAGG